MHNGDVYHFLVSLKFRPETYRTILGNDCDAKKSETTIIRRKIAGFVRKGLIGAGKLDGSMGLKVFFSLDKEYYIFIVCKDGKNYFYYGSNVDDYECNIILYNAFILKEYDWEYLGNISLLKDTIQRWF